MHTLLAKLCNSPPIGDGIDMGSFGFSGEHDLLLLLLVMLLLLLLLLLLWWWCGWNKDGGRPARPRRGCEDEGEVDDVAEVGIGDEALDPM